MALFVGVLFAGTVEPLCEPPLISNHPSKTPKYPHDIHIIRTSHNFK